MLLGELIDQLGKKANAPEVLEAVGDIVLFRQIEDISAKFDETAGEYVAGAARRYATLAEADEWLGLVQGLQRDPTSASAVLQRIVRWSLARDAKDVETWS